MPIDIEALKFFGTGSEWFWAMLQFLALSITAFAIYRQIKDNNKVLRSQAHHNAVLLDQRLWELLVQHDGLAKLMDVANETPDTLSDVDRARASNYMMMQFNSWEYVYYQDKDGSIPSQVLAGTEALIATKPVYSRFWSEFQNMYEEPFRSYVSDKFAH